MLFDPGLESVARGRRARDCCGVRRVMRRHDDSDDPYPYDHGTEYRTRRA